jgi:hypothetical protein
MKKIMIQKKIPNINDGDLINAEVPRIKKEKIISLLLLFL